MADNTARRGIYLPKELDEFFVSQSEETKIKINQLMIDALNEYKDKRSESGRKKNAEFEKKVLAVLKKHGMVIKSTQK